MQSSPGEHLARCAGMLTIGMLVAIGQAANADPYNPIYTDQVNQHLQPLLQKQPISITEYKVPERISGKPDALWSVDATGACSIGGTRSNIDNNSMTPCIRLP